MNNITGFISKTFNDGLNTIKSQNVPQLVYRTAVVALAVFMTVQEVSRPIVLFTAAALSPAVGFGYVALIISVVGCSFLAKSLTTNSFVSSMVGTSLFAGIFKIKEYADKLQPYSLEPYAMRLFNRIPAPQNLAESAQ